MCRLEGGLFHWIPVLGFGFLRRSTGYIHVAEVRYDVILFSFRNLEQLLIPCQKADVSPSGLGIIHAETI